MDGTVHMERDALEAALRRELTAPGLRDPDFAVVLPLELGREGLRLLIEVRAAGISQAGDPCLPGGRIEPGETPDRAAAREMEEELGIRADPARFLGQLPTVQTPLGCRTNVYVCTLTPEDTAGLRLNRAEVSELLRVPLDWLLARSGAGSFPFGGHVIWGMTAGALRHFCDAWRRLEAAGALPFFAGMC